MAPSPDSDHRANAGARQAIQAENLRRAAAEVFASSTVAGRALMRILAIAHLHRLDVSILIENLAAEFGGRPRHQLYQLADAVIDGTPPVEAISRAPEVVGSTAAVALTLAEQSGNLSPLYTQFLELADPDDSRTTLYQNPAGELIRLMIWFFLALLMTTFLSLFVVPTFESMFEEFGLVLPSVTLLWIELTRYMPLLFCIVFLVILIYFLAQSPRILRSYAWKWNSLNAGRRLLSGRQEIKSLIAIVIRTGLDLSQGLRTMETQHPDPRVRRWLMPVCVQLDAGSNPWHALAAARLISKQDAWVLAQTDTGGMGAWLLERSITARQERSDRRGHMVLRLLALFGTIALGLIVALTCLAVFMPLCELVTGLS